MVGAEQGQDRDDGAHEQRPDGQPDDELAQRRPAPTELDNGSPADEAHQQPVPEQGQRRPGDRHDEHGARQGLRAAAGLEPGETGGQREGSG